MVYSAAGSEGVLEVVGAVWHRLGGGEEKSGRGSNFLELELDSESDSVSDLGGEESSGVSGLSGEELSVAEERTPLE